MRERDVEKSLVRAVKKAGGLCPKFVSPGMDGVPDRIILMQGARIAFAEIKAPGKKMRPLQVKRKGQLEALGFRVYCIDRPEQINTAIAETIGGDAQ